MDQNTVGSGQWHGQSNAKPHFKSYRGLGGKDWQAAQTNVSQQQGWHVVYQRHDHHVLDPYQAIFEHLDETGAYSGYQSFGAQ
jgi:hypothetical protein